VPGTDGSRVGHNLMVKSKVLPVVHGDWPSIYHLQELGEFLQIVFSQIGTAISHGRPNQLSFCRIRKKMNDKSQV
jgi:hypothetical protein